MRGWGEAKEEGKRESGAGSTPSQEPTGGGGGDSIPRS